MLLPSKPGLIYCYNNHCKHSCQVKCRLGYQRWKLGELLLSHLVGLLIIVIQMILGVFQLGFPLDLHYYHDYSHIENTCD